MRRLFVLAILGFGSLVSAAAAQVSTDDGGGISSVRRRDDIPPGRQATEAPRGDGVDIDDLDAIANEKRTTNDNSDAAYTDRDAGSVDDDSDAGEARGGEDALGDFNTEPQRSYRAARTRPGRSAGARQLSEPALGSPPAQSRRANTAARRSTGDPRGGRPENRWRYQRYNGVWWYWTPNNRWAFFSGQRWIDYNSELAKQWARGGVIGGGGDNAMGLGGGGYGVAGSYGVSGTNGVSGRGANQNQSSLGGIDRLGTNAGGLGGAQIPGPGTAPARSAIPSFRSRGGSMAAGGLGPAGAGGSLGGGAGGAVGGGVTGEGVGSSLFGNSGGMAAVPGVSGTRGSLGGASGVGITAGSRSGDANSGVGGGMVGGAGIGGTGGIGGSGAGN